MILLEKKNPHYESNPTGRGKGKRKNKKKVRETDRTFP